MCFHYHHQKNQTKTKYYHYKIETIYGNGKEKQKTEQRKESPKTPPSENHKAQPRGTCSESHPQAVTPGLDNWLQVRTEPWFSTRATSWGPRRRRGSWQLTCIPYRERPSRMTPPPQCRPPRHCKQRAVEGMPAWLLLSLEMEGGMSTATSSLLKNVQLKLI